jgi:hypothetical protein
MGNGWYTKSGLESLAKQYGFWGSEVQQELNEMFTPATHNYQVSGNTFTLRVNGETRTLTRQ